MYMKNQEYKLNDFYQSAVLKCVGLPLLRLEKAEGKFYIFVFDNSSGTAETIIQNYWKKQLEVVARDFVDAIHELKTRLHTGI